MLALVFAKVENFKSTVIFTTFFELTLNANHTFAGSVNGELSQVSANPLSPELFRHCGGCARAAEEVGDQVFLERYTFVLIEYRSASAN